jgi:SAM-dependent methyltransferase
MIKYLGSILSSNNTNTTIFRYMLTIAIAYGVIKLYKPSNKKHYNQSKEGFYQREQFVLKRNGDIYDDFYAEVYDNVHDTKKRCQWELLKLLKYAQLDTRSSVILDVGSGTGYTLNELTTAGYKAYGIDKSQDMVKYSETIYPNIEVLNGNVEDAMTYERSTFTHILCTDFTIYQMKDKKHFFTNCYNWMKPNGFLVLHLVDRKLFNATKPKFGDEIEWKPLYDKPKPRTTNVSIDYDDFKYTAGYNFPVNLEETNIVTKNETFKDKETGHIRQNEHVLYMEDIRMILNMAKTCGFIFHAKVDMRDCIGDENQYIYIFERPH